MAIVRYGGGIAAISGSIGGVTHARNRFGSYMRQRTKPVNPNSPRQLASRSRMQFVANAWSQTLTSAQRAAWELYAASINVLNRLGESVQLTGYNMLIRSNTAILAGGGSLVADGPTIFELPTSDPTMVPTISEAAQTVSVAFDDTLDYLDEDGGQMLIYQGQPREATRNFFDGPFRLIGTIDGDSVTPPTSPASIAVDWAVTEGQKCNIQARILRADGRLSNPFRVDTDVAS